MADEPFSFSFSEGTSGTGKPQGEPVFPNPGGVPNTPPDASIAAAETQIASRRRGRKSREELDRIAAEKRRAFEEEYKALFEPKVWAGLVRAPADLMLHVSKRELWNLPDREVDTLAVHASMTAKHFLHSDPKWIALFMFSVSLMQTYGTRFALHYAEARKEAAKAKAAQRPTAEQKP